MHMRKAEKSSSTSIIALYICSVIFIKLSMYLDF